MLTRLFVILLSLFSVSADQTMIALKQRNTNVLVDAFHQVSNPNSPQYGKYWTQEQINELVAPPQKDVDKLIEHFKLHNLDCAQKGGDALYCNGFVLKSLKYIPREIYDFIEIYHTGREENISPVDKPHKIGSGDGYVGRETLIKLYNITHNTVNNPESSCCAVEYQNMGGISQNDLEMQQSLNNEPKKTIQHIVGTNQAPMMEAQLDVQMMSMVAKGADVWMWSGEQWLYSFAVNYLNSTEIPYVLSMSWGWSARDQCAAGLGPCPGNMNSSQYVHRTNIEYVKMGLRGISVMVSSGDAGAPGRTNEDCAPGVDHVNPAFPGSSPYITSVSATYVVPDQDTCAEPSTTPICQQYGCVNGTTERPTNFNETGWTTGGGFAIFNENRPTWQNTAVENYLKSKAKRPTHFQKTGRGYPDVAAVGHYCPTVMGGSLMPVDGTSCSSPIFAAMVTLLNDYQTSLGKPRLGFVNPVLYQMWTDNKQTFHDITQGNNWCTETLCCNSSFGYESTVGWDPVTGLGTPNFGLMVEWLDQNT